LYPIEIIANFGNYLPQLLSRTSKEPGPVFDIPLVIDIDGSVKRKNGAQVIQEQSLSP